MSLYVIATPIGNIEDLSPHAREVLSRVDLVIGEEAKPTRRLLSAAGLAQKPLEFLNEHSTAEDLIRLAQACSAGEVALVSDCGTPGFCDPGAELVRRCRELDVKVRSVAGPSSLMTFISVLGRRLDRFIFWGFLPRDPEEREHGLRKLAQESTPAFVIETPYRFQRLLDELDRYLPGHQLIIGLDLSTPQERVVYGRAAEIKKLALPAKPEFLIFVEPQATLLNRSSSKVKVATRTASLSMTKK